MGLDKFMILFDNAPQIVRPLVHGLRDPKSRAVSYARTSRTKDLGPMWDLPAENQAHLSHDLPCPRCGHDFHVFLPCSETCACPPCVMPGSEPT